MYLMIVLIDFFLRLCAQTWINIAWIEKRGVRGIKKGAGSAGQKAKEAFSSGDKGKDVARAGGEQKPDAAASGDNKAADKAASEGSEE